jgi:hypothetical protein
MSPYAGAAGETFAFVAGLGIIPLIGAWVLVAPFVVQETRPRRRSW